MSNIKLAYVDPGKVDAGAFAIRDMGQNNSMKVAVVGKEKGHLIVELTGSFLKDYVSNKPAVVSMEIDNDGNVLNAWGGLVGMEGKKLPIPSSTNYTASKASQDVQEENLKEEVIVGFKAQGKKYISKNGASSVWRNENFGFFGGVLKTEAGASTIVISQFEKEGATSTLKVQ